MDLYLTKRGRCQLVGRDGLQIPMDPPEFVLAPHTMTDAEYNSWESGISYAKRLLERLDYEEFNISHLMPSLTIQVYAQSLFFCFFLFLS